MEVVCECRKCKVVYSITVERDALNNWRSGQGDVLKCFPYLTDGERGLLVNGICKKCFVRAFDEAKRKCLERIKN